MVKQTSLALLCALCLSVAQAGPDSGRKPVVYLTFDDGPSGDNVTERILEVLDRYDAKATFFVTGQRARANPEKVARIVVAGHALGNHTLSHNRLTTLANFQIADEFSKTNSAVYAAGGPRLSCFRAPFGDTDERVNGIARGMGLQTVGWTIDTRDWDEFADQEHLLIQLEDSYHESIVLMHDGPTSRWRTLAVFTRWMEDSGHLYDFKALPACVTPSQEIFASRDQAPAATRPVEVKETIAQLITKLRNYKLELQPEVVAQNTSGRTRTTY